MWFPRARTTIILGSAAAIVASLATILIQQEFFASRESSSVARTKRAAADFARLEMTPLDDFGRARAALAQAQWHDPDGLVPIPDREQLIDHVAQFLHMYYAGTTEEFARWQRTLGHDLYSREHMMAHWSLEEAYQYYDHRELPQDLGQDQMYAEVKAMMIAHAHGMNQAVSMAADSDGMMVVAKSLTPVDRTWPMISQPRATEDWTGGRSMVSMRWWRPPSELAAELERNREVTGAVVGIVLGFADGSRRPLNFHCFRDAARARWQIEHIVILNRLEMGVTPLTY